MGMDITKLLFTSDFPMDKVVHTGSQTITNDGATNQAPQDAKITLSTFPNPYKRACFVKYRWSIDGGANSYGGDASLDYTFTIINPGGSTILWGLRAAVSLGVDDSNIYIQTANGYHGNVSDNGVTYTYTPVSQTFIIEYALFEREPYRA